jgi:PKD repeat protein
MNKMNFKKQIISKANFIIVLVFAFVSISCEFIDDLPEANSIEDQTPPSALFTYTNGGEIENFTDVSFANQSSDATTYNWDFGDGGTSNDIDPIHTYSGEGTFTVTLVASDALAQTSMFTQTVELIEPEVPAVPDPVLINADFDRLAKLGSSSTCACSGWDNDDIGEQGESSSGNGSDVLKYDNAEPDHIYQEFAVVPNAEYRMEIPIRFSDPAGGAAPTSELEIRILAGTGYVDGYTPTYYETAPEFPKSGYGYTTPAQALDDANSLFTSVVTSPGNDDYNTRTFFFNAGPNDSVALFIRGIGGGTGGSYGYNSGAEEIRTDSVTITAIN